MQELSFKERIDLVCEKRKELIELEKQLGISTSVHGSFFMVCYLTLEELEECALQLEGKVVSRLHSTFPEPEVIQYYFYYNDTLFYYLEKVEENQNGL